MNIEELLKEYGLELPADKAEEFNTKFKERYKSTAEHEKQVKKLEGERDNYKQKYDTAAETLKGFDGVDVKDLQKQIETYKKKIEEDNKEYNAKIAERDFNDALSKELEAFKFSSNAARESITGQIKAAGLKLVDGKIVGLNDMITSIKEKDADAFVNEESENQPRFTNSLNRSGGSNSVSGDPNKMDYDTYKKWRSENQ